MRTCVLVRAIRGYPARACAVAKSPLPPKKRYMVLDLSVEDDDGDVVMPQVQMFVR